MFDELYDPNDSLKFDEKINKHHVKKLLERYIGGYIEPSDKDTWFNYLKTQAFECGFVDMKTYKADPEKYIGNIADASNILRIALTGKSTTPDLFEIMKLLGTNKIKSRINYVINNLK